MKQLQQHAGIAGRKKVKAYAILHKDAATSWYDTFRRKEPGGLVIDVQPRVTVYGHRTTVANHITTLLSAGT